MQDCINDKHEDSIRNDFVKESDTEVHEKIREIFIDTENNYLIHRDITEKETEKNMDTYKQVIGKLPDDTSTAMMEDFVNRKLDYTNKNI